ncbi:antitoxin [Geomonas subterranea]|uniref:AbrB/MazE/SpoVT family DNA-binding domain-containing protein n=1 Tax=Geomonas subterranea TaxID=2847989 RepID=A0ABX8LH93_9BACT|nr:MULTISPECIES: AbrB/MazE/SpoVT family DNA-binding domain-containing protein [Geomonas]QXE89724.1 AbrB/MazE/SpoVT family DNA-binding domain-containing protein [Geomonas subterranea]QXM08160.1 AbrB/MazE/SpoVT family DNA-binding domain-containing protein [Geomonas subterranea]
MSEFTERHVRLFKNGRNQAIRIPREFELPGDEAIIHKEGNRLIIEPAKKKSLLGLLSTWGPSGEEFPDVDEGLAQLDDVEL